MDWKLVYSIVKDLVLVALFVYTVWSNREKVTARRFSAVEKAVTERVTAEALKALETERDAKCTLHQKQTKDIELELKRLDGEVRHLPNHNDLARLHGRIDDVHGAMREINGQMKGIGHQVNLILEELIKR